MGTYYILPISIVNNTKDDFSNPVLLISIFLKRAAKNVDKLGQDEQYAHYMSMKMCLKDSMFMLGVRANILPRRQFGSVPQVSVRPALIFARIRVPAFCAACETIHYGTGECSRHHEAWRHERRPASTGGLPGSRGRAAFIRVLREETCNASF